MAREIHLYSTKPISMSYEICDVRLNPPENRTIIIRGMDTSDTAQGARTVLDEGEFDILRENIAFAGAIKNGSFKFLGPYSVEPAAQTLPEENKAIDDSGSGSGSGNPETFERKGKKK